MIAPWLSALLSGLILVVGWLVFGFLALSMPPEFGLPWLIAVILLFLWIQVWRPRARRNRRRLAAYGVRRLRDRSAFLKFALPAIFLATAALTWVLALIVGREVLDPIAESEAWRSIDEYAATPLGWITVMLMVAVVAPLVEEFHFRGLIQRALGRRFGAVVGIPVAALLFGLIHMHGWPWVLQPFAIGMIWGWIAWTTRSIWASVLAHGTWNGGNMLLSLMPASEAPDPWEHPLLSLAAISLLATGALILFRYWRRALPPARSSAGAPLQPAR